MIVYARAVPFSIREMEFIHAIFLIDHKARISIKGKLESREDYLYGGIEWEDGYIPIPYDQVLEKINEEKEKE